MSRIKHLSRRLSFLHYALLATSVLLLSGCPKSAVREPIDTSKMTVDQVGTVRVGVVSVAPWSNYVDALQPHFEMDTTKALAEAIPTTRLQALSDIRKSTAKLGIALESNTKTVTETTTNGETTKSQSKEKKPGEVPTPSAPTVSDSQASNSILPKIDTKAGDLGLEARLHYRAATSLYQEVQVLNHYIQDVAQRYHYAPYLVRLQITLMPQIRDLPLDAYVNLTFFASDGSDTARLDGTVVAPLIATDSMENTLSSQTAQAISEIGASLKSLQNVGVGLDVGALSQRLEDLLGRDINSTFGVSRLSDNTIRVRIGALQQGSNGLAMVPRTESVTVLIMVPNKDAEAEHSHDRLIHVTSLSQLINTHTGIPLGKKKDATENQDLQKLRHKYFSESDIPNDTFDMWWNYVIENDVDKFEKSVDLLVCQQPKSNGGSGGSIAPSKGVKEKTLEILDEENLCTSGKYRYREELWAELAALQPGYKVDTLRFELPRASAPIIFPDQSVVLDDDGKQYAYARVYYGGGLTATRICGALWISDLNANSSEKYRLAAQDISVGAGGQQAVLRFDSLAAIHLASEADGQHPKLELRIAEDPTPSNCWEKLSQESDNSVFKSMDVVYKLRPSNLAENAGFTITPSIDYLIGAKDGTSDLVLVIKPDKLIPAQRVTVEIRGANIASASVNRKEITSLNTHVDVDMATPPKKRELELKLKDVLVDETVTIDSRNQKGVSQKQLQLKVRKPNT